MCRKLNEKRNKGSIKKNSNVCKYAKCKCVHASINEAIQRVRMCNN